MDLLLVPGKKRHVLVLSLNDTFMEKFERKWYGKGFLKFNLDEEIEVKGFIFFWNYIRK